MSKHHFSPHVLAVVVVLPLFALVGCASTGAKPPSDYTGPTPPVVSNDGQSLEAMFAGRFPGVSVTLTDGGGIQIRMRGGNNTFYGSNEPLYILDDSPIEPGPRGIVFVNPNDIERIEVLKNPADIAIYGVRGSNGVIKITTKRPGAPPRR
ncbi:MAG: TonB-dependent receptor plug domain-containing protein [Gemmatimonadales bacterium]